MAHTRKLPALMLTLIMICGAIPLQVSAAGENGWKQDYNDYGQKNWYYYTDGVKATGWNEIGGKWYYFDSDGAMYSDDTVYDNDKDVYYVVGHDGARIDKDGWLKTKWYGKTYWIYVKDGVAADGWLKVGKKWYYFNDGWMSSDTTVFYAPDNSYYVLGSNGEMITSKGWYKVVSNYSNYNSWEKYTYWVYVQKGGKLATGLQKIDGNYYFFGTDSGLMYYSTTVDVDGFSYYLNKNGKCTHIVDER